MDLGFESPTDFLNDTFEDVAASIEISSDAEESSNGSSMDITTFADPTSDIEGLQNNLESTMDDGNLMASNMNTLILPPDYSILITLLDQSKLLSHYKVFMAHELTNDVVLELNESHLNQICGELNVGQKLRFLKVLQEFRKMQALKEVDDETDEEPPAKKTRASVNFEKPKDLRRDFIQLKKTRLIDLLAQTNQGQILLTKRNAKLASNEQNLLITLLVEGYLEADFALGKQEFVYIADEISKVFIKEVAENYIKSGGGRGRLAEKYYHRLNYYRKCNIFSKKMPASIQNDEILIESQEFTQQEQNDNLWLKTYEDKDYTLVLEKWRRSIKIRRHELMNSTDATVATIIDKYKVLRTSKALDLLAIDFEELYPDASMNLFNKWEEFVQNVTPELLKCKKDATTTIALDMLTSGSLTKDTRDALIVKNLGFILNTKKPHMYLRSNEKKLFIPSKEEIGRSMIMYVDNETLLNEKLLEQSNFCSQFDLPVQPQIVVIGSVRNVSQIFVRVASHNYKVSSILEGLDALFKLFFVLNVKYPFEGSAIWLFFQQYFYEIKLKTDPKIAKVVSLLSLMNNID